MSERRVNIGLFVSNLVNDFDSAVCNGVMQGAKEVDANLIIFPGRYLKGDYNDKERTRCEYQYNTLFSYANACNIDVLIVLLGTVATFLSEREKKIFLDMYQKMPVILLAGEMDGFPCVNFDNKSGLKDGINNLIRNKGCRNIGFVSGPETNVDAIERLNAYREALLENGIEYDNNKIVYWNFSEYSEESVETLLDRNPDLDAIVFANDQMAIGGYNVLKKKHLKVGEDILVMGFDDSSASTMLVPNLTTVRADAVELGRVGAIEAVNYFMTREKRKKCIKTSLVQRDSTGERKYEIFELLEKANFEGIIKENVRKASSILADIVIGDRDKRHNDVIIYRDCLIDLISDFLKRVECSVECDEKGECLVYLIERVLTSTYGETLDISQVFVLFDVLKNVITKYYPDKKDYINELVYRYFAQASNILTSKKHKDDIDMDNLLWMSNSITRDMLIYGDDDDKCYLTVTDKLNQLGISSAYLYAFRIPFINKNSDTWHDWQLPKAMLLKSYYTNPSDIEVVEPAMQEVPALEIFDNSFLPKDRRYTYFLNSIFINEEQLGMLLCEISFKQIYLLSPLVAQLSSAFKIIHMLKMQNGIQKQLELSLKRIKESNEILESMSKSDELTGIYNRRGFFESANQLVSEARSAGKRAVLIFADLDNLKIINDSLGHDEGDYALRCAADILTESLRSSDIVARIGGDEFACLAITDSSTGGNVIRDRIKSITRGFNETSDIEYTIGISVGFSEFTCGEEVEVEKYLDEADAMLYEDKKNKCKDIMKVYKN